MYWEKKRLLIWGTTYPEFSRKHYETVCTGAIDGDTGRLVRIYPITLRYMEERFGHYSWVEAEVTRNTSDFRPESFKIKQDTIRIVGKVGTEKGGWAERSKWVLRPENIFTSVRALQEAEARDHTSLGLVRPKEILRVYARHRSDDDRAAWDQHREDAIKQKDLLVDAESKIRDLAFVPVEYRAVFTCEDPVCATKHDMSILDWGLYVLHRRQFAKGGAAVAERDVIARVRTNMDRTKRESYFFLGNTKQHCRNFMIVGLFHPPLPVKPDSQLSLL